MLGKNLLWVPEQPFASGSFQDVKRSSPFSWGRGRPGARIQGIRTRIRIREVKILLGICKIQM